MYVIYSNISNVCTYIYIVIRNRYIYTKHHCIQLVYISYIMPRSSLKNVKNAKTPNNVDNRNVHRATKSGRTHGEVMLGGYRQQRPVVALPKATTSSSSRQKAASVYHEVKAARKTRAQRKNHNKRRNKKEKKQNEALIEASQSHHNYTIHT